MKTIKSYKSLKRFIKIMHLDYIENASGFDRNYYKLLQKLIEEFVSLESLTKVVYDMEDEGMIYIIVNETKMYKVIESQYGYDINVVRFEELSNEYLVNVILSLI